MASTHSNLPRFDEMLGALISSPSVSCTAPEHDRSNLGVVDHLSNWLEDLGFAVSVSRLAHDAGKANLIASIGQGGDGLVLAGHTDTVPFDAGAWQSDPFELSRRNDAYYGLGACDMKGFFPVVLETLAQIDLSKLKRPLTIAATCDEESSMAGARLLCDEGRPRGRYAIVGEPTGLTPVYAHKGIMMLSIRLKGATGHSSDPALGHNALDVMHGVMSEVLSYRKALAEAFQHPGFEVTQPTMNLGCLHAGDNPNRICGEAELQIDVRLLPGMDSQAVLDELGRRIEAAAQSTGVSASLTPFYPPVPPFEGAREGRLATLLGQAAGRQPRTVAFGTEAPFYQQLGMETVVFGPGSIDQAHQPNEFLSLEQVEAGKRVLTDAIVTLCGES